MSKQAGSEEGGRSRREEILAIAAQLFARKGYRGTSMRDIGEASGVLGGSLYHHIKSKDALFVELHNGALDEAEARIAAAVAGARELSKIARWMDDVVCGVKSVDVTSTWVRGALVASSGVYVAAAWLYVLPSSLRVILDIGAFALQMITVSGILAGVFVATGLISREDTAAALGRLRETKRTAFASARAEALAVVAPRDRAGPFERDVDVASTPCCSSRS